MGLVNRNIDQARAAEKQFSGQNPNLALGVDIGGGLATGVVGRGLSPAKAILASGASGALHSMGAAEGPLSDRYAAGVVGGAAGLGLGAAGEAVLGPLVGRVAGKGYQKATGQSWSKAAAKLSQALKRDGMTDEQIKARLIELGPEGVIAEAAGPNLLGQGTAIYTEPGQGTKEIGDILTSRQNRQGPRITKAAQEAMGKQGRFYETMDQLTEVRREQAKPAFQKAFSQEFISSDLLDKLARRPSVNDAAKRAKRLAAEDDVDPNSLGYTFDSDGNVKFTSSPSMQTWHYIKMGLDDVLESTRDKLTGKLDTTTETRGVLNTKNELRNELVRLNPAYGDALNQFAGHSANLSALKRGRNFAKGDEEIQAGIIKNMTDSEKEFFREGVVRQIMTLVEEAGDNRNKAIKLAGSEKMRKMLSQTFPDKASADKFLQVLKNEMTFSNTKNTVTAGSQTKERLSHSGALNSGVIKTIKDVVTGNKTAAGLRVLDSVVDKFSGFNEVEKAKLGQWLFSQDKAKQKQALDALGTNAKILGARNVGKMLVRAGAIGASGQAGQGATNYILPSGNNVAQ